MVSVPQVFPRRPCMHLFSPPYRLCTLPILLFLILSLNVLSKKLHGTEHWMQLIVTQFSWNKRLITIFTKAPTCTCWIQSTPSYPILCNVALVSMSVYHKWSLLLQVFFNQNIIMSYACFLQAAWIANTLPNVISLLIVDEKYKPELTM